MFSIKTSLSNSFLSVHFLRYSNYYTESFHAKLIVHYVPKYDIVVFVETLFAKKNYFVDVIINGSIDSAKIRSDSSDLVSRRGGSIFGFFSKEVPSWEGRRDEMEISSGFISHGKSTGGS